jgi:archaellum component FlaG (FlaF/FlaG flagellin family)
VKKLAMQKITAGTVLAIAVAGMVVTALGALVASRKFSNIGNLKAIGVGVYSNSGCTSMVSSIDWGILEPGGTKTYTIYVKNEGTIRMRLSMTVGNWTPLSASSYISVNWNRDDYLLDPGYVVPANLTLTVSSGISGITSFSFDITITGIETS